MFIPILRFAAAGALIAGGVGGGFALWGKAKRETARKELLDTSDLQEAALRARMHLKELENEAEALGLDPAEVRRGVDALVTGQLNLQDVVRALGTSSPTE